MIRFLVIFILGALATPLAFLFVGYAGGLPTRAIDEPPDWEEKIAERALDASIAKQAKGLQNPLTVNDEVLLAGMKLYVNNCSGCHGVYGEPSPWGTTSFYPRVPQFAEHGSHFKAPEMFVVAKYGIRYSGMGAWEKLLPDDDLWRIASFLSTVHELPPAVDTVWKSKGHGGS